MCSAYAAESAALSLASYSPLSGSTSSGSSNEGQRPDEGSLGISAHSVALLRSETTSDLRTSDAGLDAWTFSLLDGRAKASRQPLEGDRRIPTSGLSSREPLPSASHPMSSSRTSTELRGPWLSETSTSSVIERLAVSFARLIWALPIADRARFYWPTPTAKANHWAPSMRKWPAYRRLQDAIPTPSPELFEWMMGLPAGWISSGLPAKESFRRWLRSHGEPLERG